MHGLRIKIHGLASKVGWRSAWGFGVSGTPKGFRYTTRWQTWKACLTRHLHHPWRNQVTNGQMLLQKFFIPICGWKLQIMHLLSSNTQRNVTRICPQLSFLLYKLLRCELHSADLPQLYSDCRLLVISSFAIAPAFYLTINLASKVSSLLKTFMDPFL